MLARNNRGSNVTIPYARVRAATTRFLAHTHMHTWFALV